jgi:hypothetical protein
LLLCVKKAFTVFVLLHMTECLAPSPKQPRVNMIPYGFTPCRDSEIGVDYAQGWHVARPALLTEISAAFPFARQIEHGERGMRRA